VSEQRTYSHSGDIGDLIAALAAVKARGGGRLILYPHECTGRRMTPARAKSLEPLLRGQSYLESVEWRESGEGLILDGWRNHYRNGLNLADMVASWLGVPHYPRERPWLTVPSVRRAARVVVGRSPRYQNWNFVPAWKRAWQEYHLDAVFVGTPEEHRDFCTYVGPLPYLPADDHLALAEVIAGAELCLFNQTGNFWLAEALKVPVVLEACLGLPNCHFHRWGLTYGVNEWAELPPLGSLRERWQVNAAKKAEDRSLLSEDRLGAIAEFVRQTERLPGAMAECGCFRGGAAKVIGTVCPRKRLHLFDTFEGLPADETMAGVHKAGEFAADRAEVEDFLGGLNVRIHQGIFPETAGGLEGESFSFVHLDLDLYEPTLAALQFFWPRMVPGGVIVLDDVDWPLTPGVNRALGECGLADAVERATRQQGLLRKPAEDRKAAYFVMGAESSGTRMMTEAIVRAGAFGDSGHEQRLDDLSFAGRPDRLVLRRSIPHGGSLPPLAELVGRLRRAGYRVIPLLMVRDGDCSAASQVAAGHSRDLGQAREKVALAVSHAWAECARAGLVPTVVHYEAFVADPRVRQEVFRHLDLPQPDMEFYDGNGKYYVRES
jgi:hypothetical protein